MITCQIGNPFLDSLAYDLVAHAIELFKLYDVKEIIVQGGDPTPGADAECRTDNNGKFLLLLNAERGWNVEHFVRVIGHELVHVKQYVYDGLDLDIGRSTVEFRGSRYRLKNDAEYYLVPWELEARGYEEYFLWRAETEGWCSDPDAI